MKSSFWLKLVYMGLALLLFAVMLPLRAHIQQLRKDPKHRLSEANLGDVDPTSSTMVLVLGGLRGVAANVLWLQALELQKEHDWTNLDPVVDSITKLQPHFIFVWTFQGWNLAYNVSVEWDAAADKYYWIKRGIKFLRRGTEENQHSPELRWDVGWTYFHKIGKSDEAAVLRRLYREDDRPEIEASGSERLPFNHKREDNYQTARSWFEQSTGKLDELRREDPRLRLKRMGEVAFRAYPARAQTEYAIAREEDGQFGEAIQRDWLDAVELWNQYADYDYSFTEGRAVKLDYPPEVLVALKQATTVFEQARSLANAATRDRDDLTDEDRDDLHQNWTALVQVVGRLLEGFGQPVVDNLRIDGTDVRVQDVLSRIRAAFAPLRALDAKLVCETSAAGDAARKQLDDFVAAIDKLGGENGLAAEELYWSDRYASMINYRYWKERSIAESEMETITARRHFHEGRQQLNQADTAAALAEFEAGLEIWRRVVDKFPHIASDDVTLDDTAKIVRSYMTVRYQMELPELPPDQIPFNELLRRGQEMQFTEEEMQILRDAQKEGHKSGADPATIQRTAMEKIEKLRNERTASGRPTPPSQPPTAMPRPRPPK